MNQGKLYLIPTIIGEGTEEKTLPTFVRDKIKDIDIFIVENIRTSRRFFIMVLFAYCLPKNTKLVIKKGKCFGCLIIFYNFFLHFLIVQ